MTTYHEVLTNIAEQLGVSTHHIDLASPVVDITPDSFALVELALGLQDEFRITLHQEDIHHTTTVNTLIQLILDRTNAAALVP